ncbi:MAG: hypothetical protein LBB94_12730 [Clostridiales bacterium]|jgi:hypothetical protein|nr:hypothetical protein [Clostridiales bacterium]
MKRTQTVTLALTALLTLLFSAKIVEANNPAAVDAQVAEETIISEETPPLESAVTAVENVPEITADPDQPAVSEPLEAPNASPVHSIELTYSNVNVTYSNGETSVHDKKYIPLIIDGTLIDSEVILVNNRTFVPLRVLTETLGGSIEWDDATRAITIYKGYDIIRMVIGSAAVTVNDQETIIDVPPNIYNNYTYIPLRFIAESLGARVSYNTDEYDRSTMTFKSYMLVRSVSANAVIDRYDASWPVLSEFQAESTVMSLSRNLFKQFMEQNNAAHPDKDYTAKYNSINYNIDNTRIIGSVSRYYVVESFSMFLFDKYTGIIYTTGSDGKSNWVRRYAEGDSENFKIIASSYFIN